MSPEARGSAAQLARLLVEIDEDCVALRRRLEDAEESKRRLLTSPSDPGTQALAAMTLHSWYTAVETIFERIARELDGTLPQGERWHRELLSQMSAEVPKLRPRVIRRSAVAELAALLSFRHFVRHAYAANFDSEQLLENIERLLALAPSIQNDLDAFAAFVREAIDQLGD